jgi:hypothetical protein
MQISKLPEEGKLPPNSFVRIHRSIVDQQIRLKVQYFGDATRLLSKRVSLEAALWRELKRPFALGLAYDLITPPLHSIAASHYARQISWQANLQEEAFTLRDMDGRSLWRAKTPPAT